MSGSRAISTTSRRELSSSFFFLARQGAEGNYHHSDRNFFSLPGQAKYLSAPLYLCSISTFSNILWRKPRQFIYDCRSAGLYFNPRRPGIKDDTATQTTKAFGTFILNYPLHLHAVRFYKVFYSYTKWALEQNSRRQLPGQHFVLSRLPLWFFSPHEV